MNITEQLRQHLLAGNLPINRRLTESAVAGQLGVSRTPVRQAFQELLAEGLLERRGKAVWVREFSQRDVADAIEVRAVLEGLAARQAVERGLSDRQILNLDRCLATGDQILSAPEGLEWVSDYTQMNIEFHQIIVGASENMAAASALASNAHAPFASPGAVHFDAERFDDEVARLRAGHRQHHQIVKAIKAGSGARVEWLMREHALSAQALDG